MLWVLHLFAFDRASLPGEALAFLVRFAMIAILMLRCDSHWLVSPCKCIAGLLCLNAVLLGRF
jgi:hypothetical protein